MLRMAICWVTETAVSQCRNVAVTSTWPRGNAAHDGVGGADPDAGSGLRGLRDRAAAIGGTLGVESVAGGGTRVIAELPCG